LALAASIAFGAGCVGSEGSSAAPSFVGNWSCTITGSATLSGKAVNQTVMMMAQTDPVAVSSPNPGQLLVDDMAMTSDCTIHASYSGGSASVTGGTCTEIVSNDAGQSLTVQITFDGGSFNLSPDGKTISGNVQTAATAMLADVMLTGTGSETFSCVPR
jgi:hypothetical protein